MHLRERASLESQAESSITSFWRQEGFLELGLVLLKASPISVLSGTARLCPCKGREGDLETRQPLRIGKTRLRALDEIFESA